MTPLPKRRISSGRQGKRRRKIKLKNCLLTSCPNCHKPARMHTVCRECGFYKNSLVLRIKTKKAKNENPA